MPRSADVPGPDHGPEAADVPAADRPAPAGGGAAGPAPGVPGADRPADQDGRPVPSHGTVGGVAVGGRMAAATHVARRRAPSAVIVGSALVVAELVEAGLSGRVGHRL